MLARVLVGVLLVGVSGCTAPEQADEMQAADAPVHDEDGLNVETDASQSSAGPATPPAEAEAVRREWINQTGTLNGVGVCYVVLCTAATPLQPILPGDNVSRTFAVPDGTTEVRLVFSSQNVLPVPSEVLLNVYPPGCPIPPPGISEAPVCMKMRETNGGMIEMEVDAAVGEWTVGLYLSSDNTLGVGAAANRVEYELSVETTLPA